MLFLHISSLAVRAHFQAPTCNLLDPVPLCTLSNPYSSSCISLGTFPIYATHLCILPDPRSISHAHPHIIPDQHLHATFHSFFHLTAITCLSAGLGMQLPLASLLNFSLQVSQKENKWRSQHRFKGERKERERQKRKVGRAGRQVFDVLCQLPTGKFKGNPAGSQKTLPLPLLFCLSLVILFR